MLYWRQGMSFNQVGAGVSDNVRTARSQVRDGRLVSVRQRVGMEISSTLGRVPGQLLISPQRWPLLLYTGQNWVWLQGISKMDE